MLELLVEDGPDRGRAFRFEGFGPVVFGRAGTPDADLQLPTDGALARNHLIFDVSAASLRMRLLKRDSPAFVNGRPVEEAELRDGDEIELGETLLEVRFRPGGGDDLPPLPGAAAMLPRCRWEGYRLLQEVGSGGFGLVHEAVEVATGRTVAIKTLIPHQDAPELRAQFFLREMDVTAALDHPNVVKVLGVGREPEHLFVVMEFLAGPTLQDRVDDGGALDPATVRRLAFDLLGALEAAHRRGIVHRDVKPMNVMFADATLSTAKLLDFGIARGIESSGIRSLTLTGEARGTPPFAAPECLLDAKRARAQADLFGLAATLYFALTGVPYFEPSAHAYDFEPILEVRLVPIRQRRRDVPDDLVEAIEGALKRDPAARWPDAAAMRAQLVTPTGP
jgi:serine/threonine protein kinase